MTNLTRREMARRIDQSLLAAGTGGEEVRALSLEARRYGFRTVCVSPSRVEAAAAALGGSETAVCTTVGFPLGANLPEVKALEARRALALGARELDMVIDIGALRSGELDVVRREVATLTEIVHKEAGVLKVIIEAVLLDEEEKAEACRIARECGVDFVKTSTGFGPGGATVEDVRFIAERVAPAIGVKAAGGIRTLQDALRMIEAGATRIGTSAGPAILEEMGGC